MAASIKDGGLALKIVEGSENEGAPYGFAIFNEESQELLDMFNAGLKEIKENGPYDEIIAKYLGEDAVASAKGVEAEETEAETEEAAE